LRYLKRLGLLQGDCRWFDPSIAHFEINGSDCVSAHTKTGLVVFWPLFSAKKARRLDAQKTLKISTKAEIRPEVVA